MVNAVVVVGKTDTFSTMGVPAEVKMFEPQAGRVVDDELQAWIAGPVGAPVPEARIIHVHPI